MRYLLFALLLIYSVVSFSQSGTFRSAVFLHHSTGANIWSQSGSTTNVPAEIISYNSTNSLSGDNAVSMDEYGWPTDPWNNDYWRWHDIFYGVDATADISTYISSYDIIIIKTCFPSSAMTGVGSPSDTLYPQEKSLYNYKWHWYCIIDKMKSMPDKFFVIWTNAPLVEGATNSSAADCSDRFCTWAKDTLAQGLDPVYGNFPPNIYVFDFFHKLADSNGYLPLIYAASSGDSHPNAAATDLVAPQFVQEVFDAAINYESVVEADCISQLQPSQFELIGSYPNPFNPTTEILYSLPKSGRVKINICNSLGQSVAESKIKDMQSGKHRYTFNGTGLPSGVYYYTIEYQTAGEVKRLSGSMILVK